MLKIWQIRRWLEHFWQRRTRGWDDTDTWSLDITVARFILPRLELLQKVKNGCPGAIFPEANPGREDNGSATEEEWDKAHALWGEYLAEMIFAMERIASGECWFEEQEDERIHRGCELFGKWFQTLWW